MNYIPGEKIGGWTTAAEFMGQIHALSQRFTGVDLQCRKMEAIAGNWDGPWRARLVTSKNERIDYRITVTGQTWEDAVGKLVAAVRQVDEEHAGVIAKLRARCTPFLKGGGW